MLIKLTNTLNSIVRRVLGVIKDGLKLWLPFEKSEILGEDLNEGFDFTSGWSEIDITEKTANTFTSDPDGGIYKTLVEVGKTYSLTIAGTTDATGVQVRNANDSELYYDSGATGAFSDTITFTSTQTNIYVKNKSAGEATITTFKIQEVTQIAPDKSGNSNGATLYTGKALSFDGVNDYVDFGSDVNNNRTVWTTAIWISNFTASSSLSVIYGRDNTRIIGLDRNGNVFYRQDGGGNTYNEFDCDVFNTSFTDAKRLVFTSDGTDIKLYLDGIYIDKVTPSTNTELILRRLMAGYSTSAHLVDATVSDFQLYNATWTQADVTFDYENPQHLVTDRAASSIALSNLKGYWHLSEGAGSFAYNSAVALGSELVTGWTNSDFDSFTSSGSNITQMVSGASGDNCYSNSLTVTSGKTYKVEFTSSQNLGSNCQVRVSPNTLMTIADVVSTSVSAGLNTFVFTATGNKTYIGFRATNSFTDTQITNFSFKEVSAGAISGATWSLRQPTIPQLGLMDWSKPTIGSDVVTLISDPNDQSKDILDNDVRLREHSLNLDGSGYAEVADSTTINPTNAITVECWIYWTDASSDKGIVTKRTSNSDYMLYQATTTKFAFYIGTTSKSNSTALSNGWNHIVGTYDKTNIKLYLNGDSDGTLSHTSAIPTSTDALQIGRYNNNSSKSYSERIDDVRIYNRALSADEVEQNYKAGLNQHKTGSSFSDDFSSDYGL